MLEKIVKMLRALNSNSNPGEIAHAFSIGVLLGFLPKGNLLWGFLFFLMIFFRINKGTYFLTILLTSLFMPFVYPYFHQIGLWFLQLEELQNVFHFLIEIPFVAFTRFNNTIVMGALIAGIVLYIPLYVLSRLFVRFWRKVAAPKINETKFVQRLRTFSLAKKITGIIQTLDGIE